jgi:hypothetical protein
VRVGPLAPLPPPAKVGLFVCVQNEKQCNHTIKSLIAPFL